jgi:4-amino-4-deoxy-L-arabinose transferase-like glycosyltransferase
MNSKLKHYYIYLFLIVSIGTILRFYKLTTIPPSLSHDEVAIAYNAYSVYKTGKDEYGKSFPILFRSFDDYKLPGMIYSTIPFVALFGKNELAARLPSAIYGLLSIIVLYAIVLELTLSVPCSLSTAFMLALQPWHINFSRQLFESNGAVFWFMLGTLYLLKSQKKYSYIFFAGLFYVVSLYFYYSVRLVIPFIVLLYGLTQWKIIMKHWKTTLYAICMCLLVFFPLAKEMFSPGGLERISIVSVTNDPNFQIRRDTYIQKMGLHPSKLNKIIYNRRVALAETIVENYWKNIAPHNIFVTGTGTYGALYPFDVIFCVVGIFAVFSLSRFSILLVLFWLVTAFLPGALSINQPNTLRTLLAAPTFAILSGLGFWKLCMLSTKRKYGFFIYIAICCVIFSITFPKFLYAYFVDNPTHNALAFGDGNKQMVQYVLAHEKEYDRIYISGYYWRPYIFMLYWGNIDPEVYQQNPDRDHIGKYYFTSAPWDTSGLKFIVQNIDFKQLAGTKKTLFILSDPEFINHENMFQKINTIDGNQIKNIYNSAIVK